MVIPYQVMGVVRQGGGGEFKSGARPTYLLHIWIKINSCHNVSVAFEMALHCGVLLKIHYNNIFCKVRFAQPFCSYEQMEHSVTDIY